MKLNGKVIKNDNFAVAAIPRPDGDIVFLAKPVLTYSRFDELCPQPKPPTITPVNGDPYPDTTDEKYAIKVAQYAMRRTCWMMLESLKDSPGIEWETVNYDDPSTWEGHIKELEDSGFTPREINEIHSAVSKANSLDDDQLEAARKRFLASLSPQLGV